MLSNHHVIRSFASKMSIIRTVSSVAAKDKFSSLKPLSEMPGPTKYPLIGSIPFFTISRNPKFDNKKFHIFWRKASKLFGKVYYIEVPLKNVPSLVVLTDPDDFQHVYRATMNHPVREAFFSLQKVRADAFGKYFGEKSGGILVDNGEDWSRVRSRAQTPMMKPKNIVKYLPMMDQVTLTFLDRIADLQAQHGEMPHDFSNELYKWALESVGLVALNRRLGCLDSSLSPDSMQMKLIDNVNIMFQALNDNEMNFPYWRYFETKSLKALRDSHEVFFRIAIEVIEETENQLKNSKKDEANLMEILLQTDGLTRKDVVTVILDMFLAGIDTTSHTIAFTLYCLAKNKEAQRKAQQEVDLALGDGKQAMTEAHLAKLSFLKACVKESLRLFPLVHGHARTLTEDLNIAGYLVPKGMLILMAVTVPITDEKYFPRPTEYLPERWSRDQPLGPIHPFASLPFSYGSRMCIGRRIAEQEMYTFLARILHRFNVDYKYEDMEIITKLVSSPSQPLRFEFKERS